MSKNQTYWVVGEQTQVYVVTELIIQPAAPAISPADVSCSAYSGGKTNKPYKFKKRGGGINMFLERLFWEETE